MNSQSNERKKTIGINNSTDPHPISSRQKHQLTKEELLQVREKTLRQRKRDAYRNLLYSAIAIVALVFFGSQILSMHKSKFENAPVQVKKKAKHDSIPLEPTEKYYEFLAEGDMWLKKENYHNAIFIYKEALNIFPGRDGYMKLLNAYQLRCEYEGRDCLNGRELITQLIRTYPENIDLYKLRIAFNQHLGDNINVKLDEQTINILSSK